MKLTKTILFFSTILASAFSFSYNNQPEEVLAPIDNIYVPHGYDDNDNIEVVVKGTIANSCYKVGQAFVIKDIKSRTITIGVKAYFYSGAMCTPIITNYTRTVNLGLLESNVYDIKALNNPAVVKPLSVAVATSASSDDYMYAPVNYADIDIQTTGEKLLTLEGIFPRTFVGCVILDKVLSYLNPQDVVVVLPIIQIVDDKRCDNHSLRFKHTMLLDETFETNGLIHVRTLDGQSYNRYKEFE